MIKRISIVGCGWLGMPLAKSLLVHGYHVLGSKRHSEELADLSAAGVEAYRLELNPQLDSNNIEALLNSDVLIVNIPPGRKTNTAEFHIAQITNLLAAAKQQGLKKVLFVSSTSVYGPMQGVVDESSPRLPETTSGKALKQIEDNLLNDADLQASVLRFSGLVGGQRKPGRFLSGKTVSGPSSPINIIHRSDCIKIISQIIKRDCWGETFNASADLHPTKQTFYQLAAEQLGLPAPNFVDGTASNKVIANNKLKASLNFQFTYPDPMAWLRDNTQEAE